MKPYYRSDINGLRALAVLFVLLYHLDFPIFSGGYLGVDVFFVISGFLITRNILRDLKTTTFSFLEFYTKRISRLMPALGVTIIGTLIAGYFILPSFFLYQLAENSIWSLISLSNIYLWTSQSYFEVGSDLKPLLHTWSLGVEEQFYIVWPFILILLYKFIPSKLFIAVTLLSAFSLVGSQYVFDSDSSAVFYLFPFRIFEFGLGALCVQAEKMVKLRSILNELMVITGIILMTFSVVYFDIYTSMPGYLSLIPCIGTMLVIISHESIISKYILSNKLFDIIGKSSYSIYLLHWPLIVYFRVLDDPIFQFMEKAILLGVSIIIGIISWKLVETPFRSYSGKKGIIWAAFIISFAFIIMASVNIKTNEGYPSRDKNPYNLSREDMTQERKRYWDDAEPDSKILVGTSSDTIIVMGNSHAKDLIYALRDNGFKDHITFLPSGYKCYNFGAKPIDLSFKNECDKFRKENLKSKSWKYAKKVFLHDNYEGIDFKSLAQYLVRIRKLTDAPIYIFGPKMVYTRFSDVIIQSSNSINPTEINKHSLQFARIEDRELYSNKLKEMLSNQNFKNNSIYYIDILEVQGNYEIVSEKTSKLLYFDSGHFTKDGAQELGEKLNKEHKYIFN